MTHKSMEISDVLQQDVFVIWAANTKVGSLVSRMSVPAIDVWFLLHKKHFYALFLVWLIDRRHVVLQMCLIKYPAERQTSWLRCWKGVFRCVHETQRRRLDEEDYNCVSPVRICCVTVSFSLLYSFRLRQESLSATQGVYQELCVSPYVCLSVLLLYSMSLQQLISWPEQRV